MYVVGIAIFQKKKYCKLKKKKQKKRKGFVQDELQLHICVNFSNILKRNWVILVSFSVFFFFFVFFFLFFLLNN